MNLSFMHLPRIVDFFLKRSHCPKRISFEANGRNECRLAQNFFKEIYKAIQHGCGINILAVDRAEKSSFLQFGISKRAAELIVFIDGRGNLRRLLRMACDKLTTGLRHDLGPFTRVRHFHLQNKYAKVFTGIYGVKKF